MSLCILSKTWNPVGVYHLIMGFNIPGTLCWEPHSDWRVIFSKLCHIVLKLINLCWRDTSVCVVDDLVAKLFMLFVNIKKKYVESILLFSYCIAEISYHVKKISIRKFECFVFIHSVVGFPWQSKLLSDGVSKLLQEQLAWDQGKLCHVHRSVYIWICLNDEKDFRCNFLTDRLRYI